MVDIAVRLMLSFVPTAMQQTHTPIYHNTPSGKTRNRRCTAVCLHILLQPSLTLDLQECHTTLHHCLLDFETTLSKPEVILALRFAWHALRQIEIPKKHLHLRFAALRHNDNVAAMQIIHQNLAVMHLPEGPPQHMAVSVYHQHASI